MMPRGLPRALALVLLMLADIAEARVPRDERPPRGASSTVATTVVLASSSSPYRELGRDISAQESIPLVGSVADALALRPTFLLWVVSPAELSDKAVTAFNLALDATPARPSAGLITGSTLGRARDLYERAKRVQGNRAAAAVGELVFSRAEVVESVGGRRHSRPLASAAELRELLRRFDYVHYAGHGSSGHWKPLPGDRVSADAIRRLPPVVVSTMSCQTTRIWEAGSIALRMVDEGAAAYSGFYYSPLAGFQIGEYDGPFRHTWADVPIGHVVEAMKSGARKGYAGFSFHLLLGDPRIALQSQPPCRLLDHGESDGVRTLTCAAAPAGLVPLRIPAGARYGFVDVPGIAAAWDGEPFYNRRLQMGTIGDDRVVLVDHRGGSLEVELRRRPPAGWAATDLLTDGLDVALVSMADRRHGGDVIALVLAAIASSGAAWRLRRCRFERVHIMPAAAIGTLAAFSHAVYGLARDGEVLVISKSIVFSPLAAVGTGLLVACGAFFYLAAASWRGRLVGAVVATSVGWAGGAVATAMTTVANAAIAARTGIGVWPYRTDVRLFVLSALGCLVCAAAFSAAKRTGVRRSRAWSAEGEVGVERHL